MANQKKINYEKILLQNLNEIGKLEEKPTLLLHTCCGPCFTIPYEILNKYFDITLIYNNSNIYPEEEYDRRLAELKKYLADIKTDIKIIEFPYDNLNYNKDLEPYADDREGGTRCRICFTKRLTFGYQYADDHGFDYFGTVMTISRYKNSEVLNSIGLELEKQHPNVKWLQADFKKFDGYEKSLIIIENYHMYFQKYCGCIYSFKKVKNDN